MSAFNRRTAKTKAVSRKRDQQPGQRRPPIQSARNAEKNLKAFNDLLEAMTGRRK
jgi:hypothetical protein